MTPTTASHPRRDALRREIGRLRDLPTPTRVVHDIWRVLSDESASAQALADVLTRDTALSARCLRLANSAYFGLPEPVADVRAACVVLGFETIRGIAVGVAALDGLARAGRGALEPEAFWRHSVGTAHAAQTLARKIGIPECGTAFCAGILHDIGRLALAATARADFARLDLSEEGAPLREQEEELFGASHDEVGGWIAERWKLPAPLSEAIRGHHGPPLPDDDSGWAALVHVADAIAHRHGLSALPVKTPAPDPRPGALKRLGLSAALVDDLSEAFGRELDRVESLAEAARGRG